MLPHLYWVALSSASHLVLSVPLSQAQKEYNPQQVVCQQLFSTFFEIHLRLSNVPLKTPLYRHVRAKKIFQKTSKKISIWMCFSISSENNSPKKFEKIFLDFKKIFLWNSQNSTFNKNVSQILFEEKTRTLSKEKILRKMFVL